MGETIRAAARERHRYPWGGFAGSDGEQADNQHPLPVVASDLVEERTGSNAGGDGGCRGDGGGGAADGYSVLSAAGVATAVFRRPAD